MNCLLSDEKVAFTIIRNHIYKENPKITREEAEDLVVGLIEANSSHSDILAMLGGKVAFNQETFIFLLYLTKIIIFFQI